MKKLLSVLLTLSMLLTLLIVPISATGEGTTSGGASLTANMTKKIDAGTEETTIDGVNYKVIWNADDFKAIAGSNNYILGTNVSLGDIELNSTTKYLVASGWSGLLDGNGYALTGFSLKGDVVGLFDLNSTAGANIIIKNLSFGTSTTAIVGSATGNNGVGLIAGKVNGANLIIENCYANVTFTSSSKAGMGAFFGNLVTTASNIEFLSCSTCGSIQGKNKIGGYIGIFSLAKSEIKLKNCVNEIDIYGSNQGIGGFLGHGDKAVTIEMKKCTNNGDFYEDTASSTPSTSTTSGTTAYYGGMIGLANNTTSLTIELCANNGTWPESFDEGTVYAGALVGRTSRGYPMNIYVSKDLQTLPKETDLIASPGSGTVAPTIAYSYTLDTGAEGAPKAYYQTATVDENTKKARVIVVLPKQDLAQITDLDAQISFNLTEAGKAANDNKKFLTLTLTEENAVVYNSIYAANDRCYAPEGYVLLAVEVTDIPATDWNGTIDVYIKAKNGDTVLFEIDPKDSAEAND